MRRTSLFRLTMEQFERDYLLKELQRHGWNRFQTARDLGICYRSLNYKIARLHLVAPDKEECQPISA